MMTFGMYLGSFRTHQFVITGHDKVKCPTVNLDLSVRLHIIMKAFLLVLLLNTFLLVESYNILVVLPLPVRSITVTFKSLFKSLATRGHNLTVISHFMEKDVMQNLSVIPLDDYHMFGDIKTTSDDSFPRINRLKRQYESPKTYNYFSYRVCELVFANEDVQKLYNSDSSFHLVILNVYHTECYYQFAKRFKSPVIGIHATIMMPWSPQRFGLPENPAVVPNGLFAFEKYMNFLERVANSFVTWSHLLYYNLFMITNDKKVMEQYFGPDYNSLEDLIRSTSLYLLHTHFTVNFPRVLLPNIIEVGGIHIGESKPLSKV